MCPILWMTHFCANAHSLVSRAWLDFSPYLFFPLKLFCAGHNLQKQIYSVISDSFTVFEGLDAQGKEGHKQGERQIRGHLLKVGRRLGFTFLRYILLEPNLRLKEVFLASWRRNRWLKKMEQMTEVRRKPSFDRWQKLAGGREPRRGPRSAITLGVSLWSWHNISWSQW